MVCGFHKPIRAIPKKSKSISRSEETNYYVREEEEEQEPIDDTISLLLVYPSFFRLLLFSIHPAQILEGVSREA